MKKFSAVLLTSGGMDSTVLAYYLLEQEIQFVPLFLDYGQHCAQTEFKTLNNLLPKKAISSLDTIDISRIYNNSTSRLIKKTDLWNEKITSDDMYLPYRNLLFLSIAVAYAQSRDINNVYAAFINSNHAKEIDCSMEFFKRLESIFVDYGSVEIKIPFKDLSKTDVAKLGIKLGVPIGKTYSCQINQENPCGACPNCVDKIEAINNLF